MTELIPLFGFTTTPLELVSFVLAMATVLLNIRQNPWAWLFSILSSVTYGVVFFDSRLYGDMSLQGVFVVVSIWGWYQWLYGGSTHHGVQVTRLAPSGVVWSLLAWAVGFVLIAWLLSSMTDTDVPRIDAFLTAGSLIGQLLLSRKKLENWHIWILVDLLYIGLYVYKGLMLTAVLYAVFIVLAVIGLRTWRKSMDDNALTERAPA